MGGAVRKWTCGMCGELVPELAEHRHTTAADHMHYERTLSRALTNYNLVNLDEVERRFRRHAMARNRKQYDVVLVCPHGREVFRYVPDQPALPTTLVHDGYSYALVGVREADGDFERVDHASPSGSVKIDKLYVYRTNDACPMLEAHREAPSLDTDLEGVRG